jgi:GT2 family glycosyltransferase
MIAPLIDIVIYSYKQKNTIMKIGIGVTTYNRPKHLELWKQKINNFFPRTTELYTENNEPRIKQKYETIIHIANDGIVSFDKQQTLSRKGIAYRKNECLRAFKDCDYVFLFDDDTFPIKEGWAEFFINASKLTGQKHFMYLKDTPTLRKINSFSREGYTADIYDNCAGCMMFFTKEAIEKVGAYNPKYGIYGYEHAGYSNRIHKAGLTPLGSYSCPAGAGEYIYSMDLDNHLPFNKQVKHEPSIAGEINNVLTYLAINKEVYLQDNEIYITL